MVVDDGSYGGQGRQVKTMSRGQLDVSTLIPFVPTRRSEIEPFAELVRAGRSGRLWQGQATRVETFQAFANVLGSGERFAAGTGVTLMPLRHPYEAAIQARSLAILSGEPVIAGFGPGSVQFQQSLLGEPYAKPLVAAREYLQVVTQLLREGTADLDGQYFRVHATLPLMVAPRVDVGLGVLRPGMARLAGRVADAAITWLTPASYLRDVVGPALQEGAADAGRTVPRQVAMVPFALLEPGRDIEEIVLASNEGHLAQPHYLDMLATSGIDVATSDPGSQARALVKGGAFLLGTPAEIAEQLDAYRAAGVGEVVLNATGVARTLGARHALADLEAVIDEWRGPSPALVNGRRSTTARRDASDERPAPTMRAVGARLLSWAAGEAPDAGTPAGRVVVLADAAHLEPLLDGELVDPTTLVLAPRTPGAPAVSGAVVRYTGRLDLPSTTCAVIGSETYLDVTTYSSTRPLAEGPRLVRFVDDADVHQLVGDVGAARETGTFPALLLHGAVHLTDLPALGVPTSRGGPAHRLFVAADGSCAVAPGAPVLGAVTDPLSALESQWSASTGPADGPRPTAGAGTAWAALADAVAADPWLPRYVQAVRLLRALAVRGIRDVHVSGFGAHLADGVGAEVAPLPTDPLVSWNDRSAYLGDPVTGRSFAVGTGVARIVDALVRFGPDCVGTLVRPEHAQQVRERLDGLGVTLRLH